MMIHFECPMLRRPVMSFSGRLLIAVAVQLLSAHYASASLLLVTDTTSTEAFFDVGFCPGQSESGTNNWRLSYNVRAGVGRRMDPVAVYLCVDYYRAKLAIYSGTSGYQTGSPTRHDLALYGEARLFRILAIGVGTFYATAGPVTFHIRGGPSEDDQLIKPGFYLFYTAGLGYDIPLSKSLFLPVRIYYRSDPFFSYYQLLMRGGIGIRL